MVLKDDLEEKQFPSIFNPSFVNLSLSFSFLLFIYFFADENEQTTTALMCTNDIIIIKEKRELRATERNGNVVSFSFVLYERERDFSSKYTLLSPLPKMSSFSSLSLQKCNMLPVIHFGWW